MSIEGWAEAPPAVPLTPWKRLLGQLDFWLVDHGFLRALYANRFALDGPFYRSNQPSQQQIRWLAEHVGIKTIINLRGYNPTQGRYQLEAEACEAWEIALINTRVHSRGLPTARQINLLKDLIDHMRLPALAHCKSGADRAGFFAVLYCHFRLGQPIAEAARQLHWRYGHFKSAKTGILDHFFETYLVAAQSAQNQGEALAFIDWVNTAYDREAMEQNFKPRGFANFWVDWILRRE